MGSNIKPEILHEDKTDDTEKKSQNSFFDIRPLHGENAIWKIFFLFFPIFTKEIQAKINAHASTPDGKGEDGATRPLPSEQRQQSQVVNFHEFPCFLIICQVYQINYITLSIPLT